MPILNNLSCPIDLAPLHRNERSLICPHGHTYDLAKSGYVNLLPVQNKRSKDPGDSKEMVAARQAFLNQQHYFPIVERILSSWPEDNLCADLRILDAGCGEGYYLHEIGRLLTTQGIVTDRVGLDISKWAVTAASKRDKDVSWLVASNARLPMPNERFDAVLCLFGFPVFAEFSRVLSENGVLLLVESGEDHLIELRKILYPAIHEYKPTFTAELEDFDIIREVSERFSFTLDTQVKIQQLLSMTPHMHKASYGGRESLKQYDNLTLTADIKFRWYQKKH